MIDMTAEADFARLGRPKIGRMLEAGDVSGALECTREILARERAACTRWAWAPEGVYLVGTYPTREAAQQAFLWAAAQGGAESASAALAALINGEDADLQRVADMACDPNMGTPVFVEADCGSYTSCFGSAIYWRDRLIIISRLPWPVYGLYGIEHRARAIPDALRGVWARWRSSELPNADDWTEARLHGDAYPMAMR